MLILLAAFNNLLAGVFLALMDAYGLSLVSVETWGLLWGFISIAFILGGLFVARYGLGSSPVRVVLLGNLTNWIVCALFTLRSSIVLLVIGTFVWLLLIPVIEAAEQTVLQRSIPFERQGRVFGFAQLVENAASPLTAFMIGPLAESVFMPFMTDGSGVDWIGGWFGTGPERGIALLFTLAGLIGIVVTLAARASRSYRVLARRRREVGQLGTVMSSVTANAAQRATGGSSGVTRSPRSAGASIRASVKPSARNGVSLEMTRRISRAASPAATSPARARSSSGSVTERWRPPPRSNDVPGSMALVASTT